MATKNKLPKFAFVSGYGTDGEGWEGFYINGKLVDENHSISISNMVELLAEHGVDIWNISFESDQYFEDSGYRHFNKLEKVMPYLESEKGEG